MEEEALQPGGSEETLLGRLFSYYGPAEGESKGKGRTSKTPPHTTLLDGLQPTLPFTLTLVSPTVMLTQTLKYSF